MAEAEDGHYKGTPAVRPQFDFSVRSWIAKQGFIAAGLGLTLVPLLAAGGLRADIVAVPLRPDDASARRRAVRGAVGSCLMMRQLPPKH